MGTMQNRNPIVYLDVKIGEEKVGRIILELFKDSVPKTVENFRALCTGEKGVGIMGKALHYKGSIFHRAVPQFMIQGGDIINFDGSGGESIYGPKFDDENFSVYHSEKGMLSMANAGPNTNSSQFFITTVPCPHLDNINVVFGKVRKGMGVVMEVSSVECINDRPTKRCEIEDCGELLPGDEWGLEENDETLDKYTPFPEDWNIDVGAMEENFLEDVLTKIKDSGNHFYSAKRYIDAGRKYKKALRYIRWCRSLTDKMKVPDERILQDTELMCLLNLAAVKLKLNLYREALECCNTALAIDKKSVKGLYRRGQAKRALNDYEAALKDLNTALAIEPNNKSIIAEISSLKKNIKNYLVIEKLVFEKMFR
ncbi:peptidyl-prolyl cis-trans isomerase D isoform X2 [Anabrus simplex]